MNFPILFMTPTNSRFISIEGQRLLAFLRTFKILVLVENEGAVNKSSFSDIKVTEMSAY